eukprot:TRINITY_DN3642_c0_g1_i4.p3 TRINITY_DN3642_c0_g1~~TRINITY_DN3642_c0_g1_i4.p3  ORF type:complete len:100 (-),score=32.34 TRINITY_DN3642_c0_g1_i4:9-308(-)
MKVEVFCASGCAMPFKISSTAWAVSLAFNEGSTSFGAPAAAFGAVFGEPARAAFCEAAGDSFGDTFGEELPSFFSAFFLTFFMWMPQAFSAARKWLSER